MENSTDHDLKQSPFPQNLTERETRPRHAPSKEEAERLYAKSWQEAEKWYASLHVQDTVDEWEKQGRHASWLASIRPDCVAYPDFVLDNLTRCEIRQREYLAKRKAKEEHNEKEREELGPREFTLTYSPAWYSSDEDAQQAFRVAIDKLTRYYKHEIKEFHAVGEFTEAGRAHVHSYYLLEGGRKITDKNFKRAYSHWNPKKKLGKGHEGGHHASVKRISDFAGYTEKHLEEAWMSIHINNADDNPSTLRSGQASELPQAGGPDPQAPSK